MGDVITNFNGKEVTDFYDLPRLLSDDVANKPTQMKIIREEKLQELTIIPKFKEGDKHQ